MEEGWEGGSGGRGSFLSVPPCGGFAFPETRQYSNGLGGAP